VFHLVIDAHRVWGNPFPTLFPFVQLLKEIGLQGMFERLLFYLPILIYVIVGIILLVSLLKKKNDPEQTDLALLAILAFGICAFGLVIWRAGFDNLLRTLAPAYILFCYILHLVRQNVLRTKFFNSSGNGVMDGIKKLGVNVLTVFLPFLFFYEMNVHHGFYAGTVGAKTIETAKVALPRMQVFTNPEEAEWIAAVVDRVETYSNKGDAILALPLNPIFYFLTDRVNPTPYDWVLPGMLDEHAEKQMVALLERNKPKVIVFVDIAIDGKEERRLPNYAPEVYEFISEHYVFEEFIGIFQILLPKSRLE